MGFFNSFRAWEGGPTLYMQPNRTSASTDFTIITIILAFVTVFLAFVTILPGIRKQRYTSLCIIALSLLSGLTILLGKYGSCWHVGKGEITTSYRAFSQNKINADMEISIGLHHMNVTLEAIMPKDSNKSMDVNFNEKFVWNEPTDMRRQYREALVKGLPYPILTVAEYLSISTETIGWGFDYRQAGYYANIALTAALVSWIFMNLFLVNIPRYGCYFMAMTGLLLCFSAALYWILMPSRPLLIRFEDTIISFHLGWCFWMTVVFGVLQAVIGLIISFMDLLYPHTFSTILDVDFDTPFDRHILIQDSEDTRKRARALKIPNVQKSIRQRLTSGSRYIRRMSTKKHPVGTMKSVPAGFYNHGFELSPASKKNSNASNTKSVNFMGDVPEISIDIHYDDDTKKKESNALSSYSTNTNGDVLSTEDLANRKISSESATSAASGSSGVSSASALSARSLSSDASTSFQSLDELKMQDSIFTSNDDSESEHDSDEEEENVNIIKINHTNERGQIIYNSKNEPQPINITWQEELIIDQEDIGLHPSDNEED